MFLRMGQGPFSARIPGIFEPTLFSPTLERKALSRDDKRKRIVSKVESSAFIRAMHPKTEIKPTKEAVERILKSGWAGQLKLHGHRAQVHLHADKSVRPIVYNRQGKPHAKILSLSIEAEMRRVLELQEGWTVVDGEWLKHKDRMFIFDLLKLNGRSLRPLTYQERFDLLPREYISPHVKTLPLITDLTKCMSNLAKAENDEDIEGLVFKSLNSKGFEDTSIIRCRKRKK